MHHAHFRLQLAIGTLLLLQFSAYTSELLLVLRRLGHMLIGYCTLGLALLNTLGQGVSVMLGHLLLEQTGWFDVLLEFVSQLAVDHLLVL